MPAPLRVLLLEVPKLLRDVLEHAIHARGDCELLRETWRDSGPQPAQVAVPDIVILGLSAAEDSTLVPALLARWPAAHVVTVTPAGGDAVVYELDPRRHALSPMSPDEMLLTLGDSVRRRRESIYA